ncbi:hypothetical protein ACWE42_06410 [Sutcliffiella cohnii]
MCSDIKQLESNINRIERFVATSSQRYFEIDNYLANKALRKSGNLGNIYKSLAALGATSMLSRNAVLQFAKDAVAAKTMMQRGQNLKFKLVKKEGKIFFQLIGAEMRSNNSWQYNNLTRSLLKEFGGDSSTYKRDFVNRLVNGGGVPLYVLGKGTKGIYKENFEIFSKMSSVSTYINSKVDLIGNMKSTFANTFKENARVWKDFDWRGVSNINKVGKFFGAAGTILTIGDNAITTFKNSNGTGWDFSDSNWRKFTVDTAVDLSVAATSVAAGAAAGSFIAPPIGTVIGAGVGAAVHFSANYKIGGPPPKSVVDHTKDVANTVVNKVAEVRDNMKNLRNDGIVSIGKNVSKIFF